MQQRRIIYIAAMALPLFFFLPHSPAAAQAPRDYMTDDEVEIVRDAQDIDDRIDVLVRMIDRRFAALKIDVGGPGINIKESSKWGPAPTGSKTELLDDIKKLLQKAIDDIDNVSAHPVDYSIDKDRSEKLKKRDPQRFSIAVRNLATAAHRYQPPLKTLLDQTTEDHVKGLILASLEFCDDIISASSKIPTAPGK